MLPQYHGQSVRGIWRYALQYYTEAFSDMIRMSQKYGDKENENLYTKMYGLFDPDAEQKSEKPEKLPPQIYSFFTGKPLVLDTNIEEENLMIMWLRHSML